MPQVFESGDAYDVFYFKTDPLNPPKVDIGSSISVSVGTSVEIANDIGNPIPISDAGGSITVDNRSATVAVTFNRPADTTAYTALDVVGSASTANHQATSAGTSGNLMIIQAASLMINNTSVPSGMTSFRIHLWDTAPNSLADNAAFAAAAADRSKYRGFIDLPSTAAVGGGFLHAFADYVGRPIRLTSTSFWFNIQTIGAYTPASATEYTVRFHLIEAGA